MNSRRRVGCVKPLLAEPLIQALAAASSGSGVIA